MNDDEAVGRDAGREKGNGGEIVPLSVAKPARLRSVREIAIVCTQRIISFFSPPSPSALFDKPLTWKAAKL
jgi:hypothetical protein